MMKRWLFLFLALPVLADDGAKTGGPLSMDIDKPKSKYSLYVPENYVGDHGWPLLVALHAGKTTPEANLKLYMDAAKKLGYLVASPKARGENWEDTDGDVILATLADVKKKYSIDPDRVCLGGYATGALMATKWGIKNPDNWRCIFAHGGAALASEPKAGQVHLSLFFSYGDKDTNVSFIKKVIDQVDKAKIDYQYHEYKDMDHFVLKPEIWENAFNFFESHFNKPEEVLARGKNAEKDKRWHDAVVTLKSIADPKGAGAAKDAEKELQIIDKAGADLVAAAVKKGDKDKPGAKKDLEEIATQFDGLACAEKAKKAIEDLGKSDKDKGK